MISEKEAQELVQSLIDLRKVANKTKDKKDLQRVSDLEGECLIKMKDLVVNKAYKYRNFHNYPDLIQEGNEMLLKSLRNYNPDKSPFFYWANQYIKTRISRSASNHSVVKFPMGYAKNHIPHREKLPLMIDRGFLQDQQIEWKENSEQFEKAFEKLNKLQKKIIIALYGLGEKSGMSVSKACKKLKY